MQHFHGGDRDVVPIVAQSLDGTAQLRDVRPINTLRGPIVVQGDRVRQIVSDQVGIAQRIDLSDVVSIGQQ